MTTTTDHGEHPYAPHIEAKAAEYFERQAHEPQCKTLQPYRPPTGTNGETYDVYIIQHCNCWLSDSFKEMTLARKFFALRNLAHRISLHSADCNRYVRTSIMYRNKPEIMTGWCNCWLSVDMRPEHPCPVCDKPLYFAPNAPNDTAKKACSDINCVNAHGIVQHFPLDKWITLPIDYEKETYQEKEHTMSDLSKAKNLAEAAEQAQRDIDSFLAPFVEKFAEFQINELMSSGFDHRDSNADRFIRVEGDYFELTGDEIYHYGEEYTPTVSLPFDFVDDPEAYRQKALAEKIARKEQAAARKKKDAQERIERLKSQLARAEADARKAQAEQDAIKATANTNAASKLRDQLDQHKA